MVRWAFWGLISPRCAYHPKSRFISPSAQPYRGLSYELRFAKKLRFVMPKFRFGMPKFRFVTPMSRCAMPNSASLFPSCFAMPISFASLCQVKFRHVKYPSSASPCPNSASLCQGPLRYANFLLAMSRPASHISSSASVLRFLRQNPLRYAQGPSR